jgi:hypothetical protein
MYWLLGYCAAMWIISTWAIYTEAKGRHILEDDPNWFLPTDLRVLVSVISAVGVILLSPIWMPPAFIVEWLKGERK